ncbi:unnamed protein product, partial [Sphacelaria rigidula]
PTASRPKLGPEHCPAGCPPWIFASLDRDAQERALLDFAPKSPPPADATASASAPPAATAAAAPGAAPASVPTTDDDTARVNSERLLRQEYDDTLKRLEKQRTKATASRTAAQRALTEIEQAERDLARRRASIQANQQKASATLLELEDRLSSHRASRETATTLQPTSRPNRKPHHTHSPPAPPSATASTPPMAPATSSPEAPAAPETHISYAAAA